MSSQVGRGLRVARRIGQRIYPYDGGARFERRLVWILGPPRSGTSWLFGMLSSHPDAYPIDEPLIGHDLTPFLADLPGADPAALGPDDFTLRRRNRGRSDSFFSDAARSIWGPRLGSLIRARFRAEAVADSSCDPRRERVIVKEPNGSQSADLLLAATPQSRVIVVHRDPRDAIDSELAANAPGAWATEMFDGLEGIDGEQERLRAAEVFAHRWAMRIAVVDEAVARHEGPVRTIKYEDLLETPLDEVTGLLDWAELDLDSPETREPLEAVIADAEAGDRGEDEFVRRAAAGGWRESLSPAEVEVIERIAGPQMRRLGYLD